jgi:exopolyphosphatase/guanosine-5'-triphosphate,3'-diphosphate pyrophosphatase
VTRIAVVDIGTNSTRLLVAEVGDGRLRELERESVVTRLGEGVDATGRLGDEPQSRVFAVLDRFNEAIERHDATIRTAVMTSAVRDAANGAEFATAVRERYGLEGATLSGDEEARLTSLGATATRPGDETVLVIDIGGGSTELVVGVGDALVFHTSTQVGVVRHSERHLHTDPPTAAELAALADDARAAFEAAVPAEVRARPAVGVGVGGTATQLASIDLGLAVHDRERVEGHAVSREQLEELRDRLAALPLAERRDVRGLDPARAPTIVAGAVILREVLGAFALDGFEASERDILWGVALDAGNA